jgi:hypothetical protein
VSRPLTWPIASLLACLLAACSGGGDDEPAPANPGGGTPGGGTPTLTLTGLVAVGAAVSGATVNVTCAAGSGTATTAASGGYTVALGQATTPCLLRVPNGATTLSSMVAAGITGSATVNITSLTTLMTAQVLGAVPNASTAFDTAAQARVTSTAIATARTDLTAALAGRVDISGFDPITTTFAVGDPIDQRLDQLAATLTAANTTLAGVSAALIANPGSPDPVRNLVAPSAAGCAAFKTGEYWGFEPRNPAFSINDAPIRLDAAASTVTFDIGQSTQETSTLTPVANEPCHYQIQSAGSTEDVVFSSSGIGFSRFPDGGIFTGSIFLPRTTLAVSELAGSWNYVGYVQGGTAFVPANGSMDIAADGTITNSRNFINLVDDTQPGDNTPSRLVQRTDGSYNTRNLTTNVTDTSRWLPHKAANGVVTIFIYNLEGNGSPGVVVLRRQLPVTAPTVGAVFPFWDSTVTTTGFGAIAAQSVTISSVNTTATPNTVTRIRASDNRVDTRSLNAPRTGLQYRAPNSCATGVGGPAVACTEAIFLSGQGTGFTVTSGGAATNGFLSLSVDRPAP